MLRRVKYTQQLLVREHNILRHNYFHYRQLRVVKEQEMDDLYKKYGNDHHPSPPVVEGILPSRPSKANRKNRHSPRAVRVLESARKLEVAIAQARCALSEQDDIESTLTIQPSIDYEAATSSLQKLPPISKKMQSSYCLSPLANSKNKRLAPLPTPRTSPKIFLKHTKNLMIKRPATAPIDGEIRALLRSCPKEPVFLYDEQKHHISPSAAFRYSNSAVNSV